MEFRGLLRATGQMQRSKPVSQRPLHNSTAAYYCLEKIPGQPLRGSRSLGSKNVMMILLNLGSDCYSPLL